MNVARLLTCLLVASVLASHVDARDVDASKYSSSLRRFIEDVTFRVELGDKDNKFIRLPDKVDFVFHGDPAPQAMTRAILQSLVKASGISSDSGTKINFYFGSMEELREIAKSISREIEVGGPCSYWKWWNHQHVVTRAAVFVCTDGSHRRDLRSNVAKSCLHLFGMPSTSDAADNSILLTGGNRKVEAPTELDLKVLEFLYRQVPSGSSKAELRALVRDGWDAKK